MTRSDEEWLFGTLPGQIVLLLVSLALAVVAGQESWARLVVQRDWVRTEVDIVAAEVGSRSRQSGYRVRFRYSFAVGGEVFAGEAEESMERSPFSTTRRSREQAAADAAAMVGQTREVIHPPDRPEASRPVPEATWFVVMFLVMFTLSGLAAAGLLCARVVRALGRHAA